MNEISPCKGCPNRHPACHDSCEAYKAWKDRYHAQQKHLEVNKNRFDAPWSPAKERSIRSSSRFCAYGRKQGGIQ